ncbi:MAG: phosphatase [Microbacterium sp.]
MSEITGIDDAGLREHLERTGLAGAIATDRSSNIGNLRGLAARDPYYMFGLDIDPEWDEAALLTLMNERAGISVDPAFERGQDRIDPELTAERLTAFGRRLGRSIDAGDAILVATGHPHGVFDVHVSVARYAAGRGIRLLGLSDLGGERLVVDGPEGGEVHQEPSGVHLRSDDGRLLHTHSPLYMELLLDALAARGLEPGLVVADHGWAGAAGARGIPTIGFADSNDPALFVGEAQGDVEVCVPIDDGLAPETYGPVTLRIVSAAEGGR